MISKEHKKHSHITRPSYGNFSRNEWAIVGASDEIIEELAQTVTKELSPFYECAYIGWLHQDNENHHSPVYDKSFNKFRLRQMFADVDMVIANGNFQQAKAQVIVIDKNSENLLQNSLALLTDVQLILMANDEKDVFNFVKHAIPNWQQLPVYGMGESGKIAAFFQAQMKRARPLLKGLVLAGGKSLRMGSDKGSITWYEKEQRYYIADLLGKFCDAVFISCRADQHDEIDSNYKIIEDSFTGIGPYGAILSAFREQPDCAWLVTACDMPLLDINTLDYLIKQRRQSAMATTFESPRGGFPEPLITIWEPKSYPVLLAMLSQGYTCPRKALENNNVCLLKPPNPDALINVNTPEEMERAKNILRNIEQR